MAGRAVGKAEDVVLVAEWPALWRGLILLVLGVHVDGETMVPAGRDHPVTGAHDARHLQLLEHLRSQG